MITLCLKRAFFIALFNVFKQYVTAVLSTMASYAITRIEWKLSEFVYTMFLIGMTVLIYELIIPSIVVYILLHKQIMEGMVAGAVKG